MAIDAADIVVLRPTSDDVHEAVAYAIKSAVPYTYNRMGKDAWRRVARIARGKVNESLIRRFATSLGVQSTAQTKSHRQHDAFDFTFAGKNGRIEADVKTFHVLAQFVQPPRNSFSIEALLSGIDSTSSQWHLFFPMLVPMDYKRHKDIYIFAVSNEAPLDNNAVPALLYPWVAFPDAPAENFLVDPELINRREQAGATLDVTVEWPEGLQGEGNAIYERKTGARQKALSLSAAAKMELHHLSSFLALQLDDSARARLRQRRTAISLAASDGSTASLNTEFNADRFYEVFPRQDFALHLIGWINRKDFERVAQELPIGAPCYFYPPRSGKQSSHAPGTKTANRYVLPNMLNPIAILSEV